MWALVHRPAPFSVTDFFSGLSRMGLGFGWLGRGLFNGRVRLTRRGDSEEDLGSRFEELMTPVVEERPLPMTTKPTIRVDSSVNVFNYDCGL